MDALEYTEQPPGEPRLFQQRREKKKILSRQLTNLCALVVEAFQEALQELVGIVDSLGVLAHDPNHGSTSVWLVQGVEVFTEGSNDAFIPVILMQNRTPKWSVT